MHPLSGRVLYQTVSMAALRCAPASGLLTSRNASEPARTSGLFLAQPGSASLRLAVKSVTSKRTRAVSAEVAAESSAPATSAPKGNWLPLLPIETLPKGERRLVKADGETILLLWYKNEILAIENQSPAEGAYSEGLFNAKLTQDGCIICPLTDSTFELKTGKIKDWFPNNFIMRLLTPPLRELRVYPVTIQDYQICINLGAADAEEAGSDADAAELVFARVGRAGETASDVNVDEVRMLVDESQAGFGFNPQNELLNGRAAMMGFVLLLVIELLTGKGLLGATGFLDFLYQASGGGPAL